MYIEFYMNYMCLFTVLIVKQKPQQQAPHLVPPHNDYFVEYYTTIMLIVKQKPQQPSHPVPPHNDYFVEYYTMVMLIVKETTTTSPTPSTTI